MDILNVDGMISISAAHCQMANGTIIVWVFPERLLATRKLQIISCNPNGRSNRVFTDPDPSDIACLHRVRVP